VRIGHARGLAADDLQRAKQHANVEERVDACLRGDEMRDKDAGARRQHDADERDRSSDRGRDVLPEAITVGRGGDHE
jgi:hypothetical protein